MFVFSQYLGSMLVKELRGTESTQDACAKMRVKHSLTHSICAIVWKPASLTSIAEVWGQADIAKMRSETIIN